MMIPMLSNTSELDQVLQLVSETRNRLERAGHAFDPAMPVGGMIEIPAAALSAGAFAARLDFLSIGTNDLIQYCLAIDRGNEHVAYLYEPMHPAVLQALIRVCNSTKSAGIEIGMCGEMAGEDLYSLVLIALGFDELSMNATNISRVKRVMRQVKYTEVQEILESLLSLATADEVASALENEMRQRYPQVFAQRQL